MKEKPYKDKEIGFWMIKGSLAHIVQLDNDLLPEVKWTDDEPKEILIVFKNKVKNK